MSKITTIDFSDVRDYYERNNGGNWFDKDTLKFWGCRLPKVAYETNAGLLFVTAEDDFSRTCKRYSIRRQLVTGKIETVGEFQRYRTRAEAISAIRELHNGASA